MKNKIVIKNTVVVVDGEQHKEVKMFCLNNGISLKKFVKDALNDRLKKEVK